MRRAILSSILLILLSAGLAAQPMVETDQPRFGLGFDAGPVLAWYTDLPLMASATHGVERADAFGVGFMGGVSGTWWLEDAWGIRGGVRYLRQYPSVTLQRTIPAQVEFHPNDSTAPPVAPADVLITSSGDFEVLDLSVAYIQRFTGDDKVNLSVLLGPALSFVTVANRTESIELASAVQGRFFDPDGHMVENDQRKLILFDGEPVNRSHLRFSLFGGLQLETRLARDLSLVAAAEYQFPLAGVADGRIEGRVYALQARGGMVWYMK